MPGGSKKQTKSGVKKGSSNDLFYEYGLITRQMRNKITNKRSNSEKSPKLPARGKVLTNKP